jgi:hypothetical protein
VPHEKVRPTEAHGAASFVFASSGWGTAKDSNEAVEPTTTPVYVAGLGWVLLNDEGTYTPTKETL